MTGRPRAAPGPADPLVVRSLEFLGGMASDGGWRPPPRLPEVAFAGRSNVGKSSLINRLVNRKKAARVSNTPGRTREINFFEVNGRFVLADLPGYGYARISKEQRAAWRPLIEGYLRDNPLLRGVVQLLDARHHPSDDDLQMLDFLASVGTPTIVVATKIDLPEVRQRVPEVQHGFAAHGYDVLPLSAATGEGISTLISRLAQRLQQS